MVRTFTGRPELQLHCIGDTNIACEGSMAPAVEAAVDYVPEPVAATPSDVRGHKRSGRSRQRRIRDGLRPAPSFHDKESRDEIDLELGW